MLVIVSKTSFTIARRFEEGQDPYGRGAEYDCVRSTEHAWLQFV
jgi:hypothetical protein